MNPRPRGDPWIAEFWRRSPLLNELGSWLPSALKGSQWPDPKTLNAVLDFPRGDAGGRLRLVTAQTGDGAGADYEQRIHVHGEIATRGHSWHDFFNALIWSRFPRLKLALNATHCMELGRQATGRRNRHRDALTLFDECGVVVLSERSELLDQLRQHRWRDAFVALRCCWRKQVRVLVLGHALYVQALMPFPGWTAKALLVCLDPRDLAQPDALLRARVDAKLAGLVRQGVVLETPGDLSPLPLLGIPGMDPANAAPTYYDDDSYFRPRHTGRAPAPVFTLGQGI